MLSLPLCRMRSPFFALTPQLRLLLGWLGLTLGGVLEAQTGNWTVRNVRGTGFLWAIAASGTRLVAVGTEGRIVTSDDGITWVARNSGVTDWLVGVTYGSNRFVAVGDNGRILTSPDGTTWTTVSGVPTTARLNNVIYAGQRVVAVGEQGAVVVSNSGGTTWQNGTTGVSGGLRGLTFLTTRSYLFAPFGGGTSGLSSIRSVSEAAFVASGQGGAMITSVDGLAWQPTPNGTTDDLEALVSVRGQGGYGISVPTAAIAIGASGAARSYQAPTTYFTGIFFIGYTGTPPTLPGFAAWTS